MRADAEVGSGRSGRGGRWRGSGRRCGRRTLRRSGPTPVSWAKNSGPTSTADASGSSASAEQQPLVDACDGSADRALRSDAPPSRFSRSAMPSSWRLQQQQGGQHPCPLGVVEHRADAMGDLAQARPPRRAPGRARRGRARRPPSRRAAPRRATPSVGRSSTWPRRTGRRWRRSSRRTVRPRRASRSRPRSQRHGCGRHADRGRPDRGRDRRSSPPVTTVAHKRA